MSIASILGTFAGTVAGSFAAARQRAARVEPGSLASSYASPLRLPTGQPAPTTQLSDTDRYLTSDDVYGAVTLMSRNAARVPFDVVVRGEVAPDHPLKLLLDRCNNRQGGRFVWQRWYSWHWLLGEVYLAVQRTNPVDPALPNELWVLSANTVDPVLDEAGYVDHYALHRPGWPGGTPWPREDVVPYLDFNPHDPTRGLSPLSSLRLGLDTERAAKSANRDIFTNGLMADAAVFPTSPDGLEEEQRERLKASLEERHVGEGKRHQIMVFPVAMTLEKLQLTPADAQFIEQDRLTTKDVAKAYGIPPMFLGQFDDATLSNYQIAFRALFDLAIIPAVEDTAACLTTHLAWQYGDDVAVVPDLSGIEALREDAIKEATAVGMWVRAGYDRKWAAERVTGDPIPDEAVGSLIPVTLQPREEGKAGRRPLRRAVRVEPRLKAILDDQAERQAPLLVTARERLDAAFAAQAETVTAALRAQWTETAARRPARLKRLGAKALQVDGFVLTVLPGGDDDPLMAAVADILADGLEAGGESAGELFDLDVDLGRVNDESETWLRTTAAADVADVNEVTREAIRQTLAEGLAAGEGLPELVARVEAAFGVGGDEAALQRYANRARAIAETELASAYNHGSNAAIEQVGLNREWLSARLPTTRPEHAAAHNQVRAPGVPFRLGSHSPMYPADPALPPEHRIYCHCAVAATEKEPTDA